MEQAVAEFLKDTEFVRGISMFQLYVMVRWFIIAVDVILVLSILYIIWKSRKLRVKFHPRFRRKKHIFTLQDALYRKRWERAVQKFSEGSTDGRRLAIIEADKLVDDALKQSGLKGNTMNERLTHLTQQEITTLERLRRAHRVRNNIVHTPGYQLTPEGARTSMEDYQAFMREIKVL